ncbi:MAG: nitroreductase family deazaflavin-dependent oxidoreductase [Betaproteobacteria bacterium]|nr:nitroreductase family deazaflavin-dependent oxidoreductase [Betaproteobacteria bacterium]
MATNDANLQVIEEFRANSGRVGGNFEGRPLLLLTITGRKTGRTYTTPVMYLAQGDDYCVFASKGGAPEHPAWYLNLVVNPRVIVEVGTERFEAQASVVGSDEREAIYRKQASLFKQFVQYEQKTTRKIPVVRLTRTN